MQQYLLSVHHAYDEPTPSEEEIQQAYRDVDAFNTQLRDSGRWVFAGGLHPPSTATVVRVQDGEVVTTDGPYAETKEQRPWPGRARRPRPAVHRWRSARSRTTPRTDGQR